jgi:hypothetical protein
MALTLNAVLLSPFNSSQSLVYQTLRPFLAFLSPSTYPPQGLFPMSRSEEPEKCVNLQSLAKTVLIYNPVFHNH